MEETFDVIVVGAGAAGCVLASRLSEVADKRVLLIEAGPDVALDDGDPEIRAPFPVSMGSPRLRWPGLTAMTGIGGPAERPFAQGLGIGGGSNINGMIAYRGVADDYDRWREDGVLGWSWAEVLPYFRRLERDLDIASAAHGSDGPIPIRRVRRSDWGMFSKALGDAAMRHGYPYVDDCNADQRDGVHPVPMSNLPARRVSAAAAYLTPAVRARRNLTIMARTTAERLRIANGRATGVLVREHNHKRAIAAREIIVSCGAIFTPALLMRSGVGDGDGLRHAGIALARHLPGVGRNLINKPKIEIAAYLPRQSRQHGERGLGQNCLRFSSHHPGGTPHDLGLKFANLTGWHPLGAHVGAIVVCLYTPHSRGYVALRNADADVAPKVVFNALSDSRDLERLAEALALALTLLEEPSVRAVRREVFLVEPKIAGRLMARTARTWAEASAIALVLAMPALRRILLRPYRLDIDALVRDEAALKALIIRHGGLGWHVCGTCKMGAADDPLAVTDNTGAVNGIAGLRVADASLFPAPVGEGGMHLPVLMAAEKIADHVKAGWHSGVARARSPVPLAH